MFWKILQITQENTCVAVSFKMKLQAWTPTQMFSCKFCKIIRSTFFHRPPTVANRVLAVKNIAFHIIKESICLFLCTSKDHHCFVLRNWRRILSRLITLDVNLVSSCTICFWLWFWNKGCLSVPLGGRSEQIDH